MLSLAEGEPPPLEMNMPEISSLEELDALKPDLRFDGWELRIALSPGAVSAAPRKKGGAPDFSGSPWRVLCADFRRIKEGSKFPSEGVILGGESLGPFEYQLEYEPEGEFDRVGDEKLMEIRRSHRQNSDYYFFAAIILTPGEGAYRIRVYEPMPEPPKDFDGKRKDKPMYETVWKQEAQIPSQWTEFAKGQYVDLLDLGIPVPDQMVVPFVPSAPRFDEFQSLLHPDEVKGAELEVGERRPIPGMIPQEADPAFVISLSASGISIRLEDHGGAVIDHFLARWWIDDKPVTFNERPSLRLEPERAVGPERNVADGEPYSTRVPFQLPYALNKADSDSKITLQLLFSPMGTEELPNPEVDRMERLMRAMKVRTTGDLRISNKLEFKLGDVVKSK